jgi:hypothetical protein
MKVTGPNTKARCVRYDRSSKSKPWEALIHLAGKRKRVGRYATRELAEAAVQGARKAVPALPPGRPRMPQEKRQAILDTYHAIGCQKATAEACQVSVKMVERLLCEARQAAEVSEYPDMAVELA